MQRSAARAAVLVSVLGVATLAGGRPAWAQRARATTGAGANAGASPGATAGAGALLELGRQQYDDLRYEEALQTLSAALLRPGSSTEQEVQVCELLALSYLALARNDEAEGAFRLLLARAPEHALSTDLAPRIREFFAQVRTRWIAQGRPGAANPAAAAPVTIEHRSPAQHERNRALSLTANVEDPAGRVSRLVLAYRPAAQGLFRRVDSTRARPGGPFNAEVSAENMRPPALEYYLEAVDLNGVPVTSRGDALAPLRVVVPEPGGIPWWGWATGGAVVVTAVVITAVVLSTQNAPARLTVEVTGE